MFQTNPQDSWYTKQDQIAQYMVDVFKWCITPNTLPQPAVPVEINIQLACDCTLVAEQAASAFLHPLHLCWNIADYCRELTPRQSGQNPEAERLLAERFPVLPVPDRISRPITVVDSNGHIVLWHLPNAISMFREDRVWSQLDKLNPYLNKPAATSKGSWRASADLFNSQHTKISPGLLNLSPAWFQTGHEAGKPEVSATLKAKESPVLTWVEDNQEFSRIMGGLLAIVHPDLYSQSLTTLRQFASEPERYLKDPEPFIPAIRAWGNPFGGLALICNRETPIHRDNNSRYHWYDILASIGEYEGLEFNVPGIGAHLSYESGTIVAVSGRALTHQVPKANGERACFAYFVRDKVLKYAGKDEGGWPRRQNIIV